MRLLRKLGLCVWSPPVAANYYGSRLVIPGIHDLPILANDLPLINTPLRRLAAAVRVNSGQLRLLDVGANVGEGIPLVGPISGDRFWLVEGSTTFLPFLRKNVGAIPGVIIFPTYLGAFRSVSRGAEVIIDGNAHINPSAEGEISYETLDHLFPSDATLLPNLVKIDVEGFEPMVLAGAHQLLAASHPVIFMEWFPKLLLDQGLDVFASLDPLLAVGYDEIAVYDNHGHFIDAFSLTDRLRLGRLAAYGRMRDLFYFDLVVFAPIHGQLRHEFLSSEQAFYAGWLQAPNREAYLGGKHD